jgi:hypothetical protein
MVPVNAALWCTAGAHLAYGIVWRQVLQKSRTLVA